MVKLMEDAIKRFEKKQEMKILERQYYCYSFFQCFLSMKLVKL